MLFENTPRPSNGMPSNSRTALCAPSAATRYWPRIVAGRRFRRRATRHRDAVGVLLEADDLAPLDHASRRPLGRPRRIGSRPGWVMNRRRHGLSASSTPDVEAGDDVGELSPGERVHADDRAFGEELLSDCALTSSSMPGGPEQLDRAQVEVRRPGSGDPPRRRSTTIDGTPCWARNIAVESPTSPPPEMTTGCSAPVTPRRIARSRRRRRPVARTAPCARRRG